MCCGLSVTHPHSPTLPVSPAAPPAPTTSFLLCTGCGCTPVPYVRFFLLSVTAPDQGPGGGSIIRPAKWRPEASKWSFPFCPREWESPTCHLPHIL